MTGSEPEDFCGFETIRVEKDHEKFHQSNDMFCRGFWDASVRNKMTGRFFRSFVRPGERARSQEGFESKDYALRNGPWVATETLAELHKGSDRRDGFWDDFSPHIEPKAERDEDADPAVLAAGIKQVALAYGADLVGVTGYEDRWTYASKFSTRGGSPRCKPMEIPDGLTNVVVIAKGMDFDLLRTSPSATASTAPAIGYAHDATLLVSLAQYIRSLGYQAVACQNDTTVAIPYAIQAGLGEYGRNGLLITKDYGPRVRLGRVLTDMPLTHDKPIRFGVSETCETCRRCANNCPPQAIDHGAPSTYRFNISNVRGIKKWTTDAEKCFKFWVSRGTDCANCIRTCPYNKDYTKLRFRMLRRLLGSPLRKFALALDDRLGLHHRMPASFWWNRDPKASPAEKASGHAVDDEKVASQERVKNIRSERAPS